MECLLTILWSVEMTPSFLEQTTHSPTAVTVKTLTAPNYNCGKLKLPKLYETIG